MITKDGGTAHGGAAAQNGIFSDFTIVRDLDEVINFCAALDNRRIEAGAIDTSVGADFHIVADFYVTDLRNFFALAVDFKVAKAVGADDGARMDGDALANFDALANGDVWIKKTIVTDFCKVSNITESADDAVIADGGAFFNDGVGLDRNVFTEYGRGRNYGRRMNARGELDLGRRNLL